MHPQAHTFVVRAAEAYRASGPVYEIGSRNINGSIARVFPPDGYLGIDLQDGPGVDVVADAATFRPDRRFATAVCCEVLEHTPEAEAIIAGAAAALAVGGLLIVTCAGEGRLPHSAVDGGPLRPGEYYQNRTEADLETWAAAGGIAPLARPYEPGPGDVYFVGRKGRA